MAKILKGKNPEDAITEKMIQNGIKKHDVLVSMVWGFRCSKKIK